MSADPGCPGKEVVKSVSYVTGMSQQVKGYISCCYVHIVSTSSCSDYMLNRYFPVVLKMLFTVFNIGA